MDHLKGYPNFDFMTYFVWEVAHSGKKLPSSTDKMVILDALKYGELLCWKIDKTHYVYTLLAITDQWNLCSRHLNNASDYMSHEFCDDTHFSGNPATTEAKIVTTVALGTAKVWPKLG